MSHTEGTALLLESEWLFSPASASYPPLPPLTLFHSTHSLWIQSVILQALKKTILKTSSIQLACRICFKMIVTCVTALLCNIRIWHDSIISQEKHSAFNTYFKILFLKVQNVRIQPNFADLVTYEILESFNIMSLPLCSIMQIYIRILLHCCKRLWLHLI